MPRPLVPSLLKPFLPDSIRILDNRGSNSDAVGNQNELRSNVVAAVKSSLASIKSALGSRFIPVPDVDLGIDSMSVSARTYNCLRRLGVDSVKMIGSLTINDLLRAKNFGVLSLVDLLTALEDIGNFPEDFEFEIISGTAEGESADNLQEETTLQKTDVEIIRDSINFRKNIPHRIRQKTFPPLPRGFRFEPLNLSNRSLRRLGKIGLLANPDKLTSFSIDQLLRIDGFGKWSLHELASKLESFFEIHRQFDTEPDAVDEVVLAARALSEFDAKEFIKTSDVRFGHLFHRIFPDASDLAEVIDRILAGEIGFLSNRDTLTILTDLKKLLIETSSLTLEQEIENIASVRNEGRNVEIFVQRYGVNGQGVSTLQEVGDKYGITRERVRQLCSNVEKSFTVDTYMPVLDRVITLVETKVPAPSTLVETAVKQAGLTSTEFKIESIVSIAKITGRCVNFTVELAHGSPIVLPPESDSFRSRIRPIACKLIDHLGVARLEDLINVVSGDYLVTTDIIENVICSQPDFHWLDNEKGWFWLSNVNRSPLRNQIRKILSVTPKLHISDLRKCVRRHYRMQGVAPPINILKEYCRQQPDLLVENDTVRSRVALDMKKSLNNTEYEMVSVLKANGDVMRRTEFEEACLKRGIPRPTFFKMIDYSPVINRLDRGVYGLRGAIVSMGQVDELIPRIKKGKVLQDFGWKDSNQIWIAYRLSINAIRTGSLSVPTRLKELLSGVYRNSNCWDHVKISGSTMFGLDHQFRIANAKANDYVLVTFNLREQTAEFLFGDESILDKF